MAFSRKNATFVVYLRLMTMKRLFTIMCCLCCGLIYLNAQSAGSYFGIKGGLTLATQQWNTFDREPLVGYHGIFSVETLPEQERFSLFAQVGYHVKGSAIRSTVWGNPFNGGFNGVPARKFEFYNISLSLGAKQRFSEVGNNKIYYLFGIRGDFTVDTNLDEYTDFVERNPTFAGVYPIDSYEFIRRINYGFIAGGGFEFPFSEFVEGVLEFTVNPDFSLQYQQPAIPNVIDPFTGNTRTISERRIRNLTFEITVGARFLRKIEYYD